MSIAAAVYDNASGAVSLIVAVVVLSRFAFWVRARAHRPALATGDAELSVLLDQLVTHRTRRLALIVAESGAEPRIAYVDASEHDRFELGSLSKIVTGLVIADCIDRSEMTVETTLGHLDASSPPSLSDITIRQLVTHTSGLPRLPRTPSMTLRVLTHGLLLTDPYARIPPERVVDDAAGATQDPAKGHVYSNLGAAVAGLSVAASLHLSYATLVGERLFTRLGMGETTASAAGRPAPRGWDGGRRAARWRMDGYAPAGGVVSTPADVARLARAIADGTAPGVETSMRPVAGGHGIFWVLGRDGTVWHNGETGGYSSYLTVGADPVRRVIVVLADTVPAEEQQRIAEKIGDALSVR